MSVPFTIENKTYRFQFDLGANTTMIYDKCFEKTEFIKKLNDTEVIKWKQNKR